MATASILSQFALDPAASECREISVNGAKIGFALLGDKCDTTPRVKVITAAAAAIGDTTVNLTYSTQENASGVQTAVTATDKIWLAKGTILHFGPATGPWTNLVTVAKDTTLIGLAATDVPVKALTTAITATDVAETIGAVFESRWMDITLTMQNTTQDASEGEDYFDSTAVTAANLTVTFNYKLSEDSLAHRNILWPYQVQNYANLYAVIKRKGLPLIGGVVKILNPSFPGQIKGLTTVNTTLNFQGFGLILPTKYYQDMTPASAEATEYEKFCRLSGLRVA